LSYYWPGLYIPILPETILIDNPNNELILKRQKILNDFCDKITKFKYIMKSNELNIFLNESKNNNNNNDEIIITQLNYNEIYSRYINNFGKIENLKEDIDDNNKVEQSIILIKNNISNLNDFYNDVSTCMKEKENEIKGIIDILNIFSDYEKNILIQYSKNDMTKLIFMNPDNEEISTRINNINNFLINPFKELLLWIENDILDFKSMLNALEKFKDLISLFKQITSKINEINKKIKEINNNNNNQNNYLNMLISCSLNENKMKNLIENKEINEKKRNDLLGIINIIDFVNEEFIKKFKNEKIRNYNEQFEIFVNEEKKNRDIINNIWNCISEATTNIKNQNKENKEQSVSP